MKILTSEKRDYSGMKIQQLLVCIDNTATIPIQYSLGNEIIDNACVDIKHMARELMSRLR